MEEIQFSNQENQVNFVPEAPKVAPVAQMPANRGSKILPWAAGIGLALVGGAIFYKVNLNRQTEVSEVEVQTRTQTPSTQDVAQLPQAELETLNLAPERARVSDYTNATDQAVAVDANLAEATNLATKTAEPTTKGGLVVKQVAAAPVVTTKKVVTTVKSGYVSGTVYVNGNIPNGSSILVLYRLPGASEFTAGPRLEARNGVTWALNLAAGTTYEMKLVWQVNNDNYLAGETKTITTPAKLSTTFNFSQTSSNNGGSSNEKPWLPILDTCGNYSDNKWTARILLPKSKDNLVAYHVMIGTSSGKDDVRVETFEHTDRFFFDQKLDNDKDYYVRYQIKTSDGKWSDWSDSLKIKCRRS